MLDNRIIFTNLPPGVQTCINTHLLGLILALSPKTREVRRSRNASRCSAPGSNSSSVLKRSLWAVIHSEHMNRIHLGVGCRGGGERLLLLAPVHTSSIPRREPRLGISIQFCRVPPQIFYLLPPAAYLR